MKGMGKAMPKDDNLIVPHNATLVYGVPTSICSTEIHDIMNQIEADFNLLRESNTIK